MAAKSKLIKKRISTPPEKIREYEVFKNSLREINNVLIAYAGGDFSKRGVISNQLDSTDAIINGINMLGEELEDSTVGKNYFLSIFNAVPDLIFVLDQNGYITNCNKTDENSNSHYNTDELMEFEQILEHSTIPFSKIKNHLKTHSTFEMETVIRCPVKKRVPSWCIFSTIKGSTSKSRSYLVVSRDISDQKEMEKRILRAIVETQENEQQRLAQDLHDSFGQELSGIRHFIASLTNNKSLDKDFVRKLDMCANALDENINNIRNICFNLMPGTLSHSGINQAVLALISKLQTQSSHNIHFIKMKKKVAFPKNIEVAIYRIIQEFITNSIKHADCKNIYIELNYNKNIYLYLSDDGIGFDIDSKNNFVGNGLRNMNSRANAFNGKFIIESAPGQGTKASVILPLKNELT